MGRKEVEREKERDREMREWAVTEVCVGSRVVLRSKMTTLHGPLQRPCIMHFIILPSCLGAPAPHVTSPVRPNFVPVVNVRFGA